MLMRQRIRQLERQSMTRFQSASAAPRLGLWVEKENKPWKGVAPISSYSRTWDNGSESALHLSKGTNLDDMTQDELNEIIRRSNNTPLKVLGWLTPAEAWDEQMERLAAQGTPVPGHPVQSTTTHNTRQCCTSN